MSLSNYPPGVSAWDIEQLYAGNFPDCCPSCGHEIEMSYDLKDGPLVDVCGVSYHARCASELWLEQMTDEELESAR